MDCTPDHIKGNGQKLAAIVKGGKQWLPLGLCRYVWQHIQRHMYDNTRFNLVKSANPYRLHMTVCRTTRAYNGTIATKGPFIMCPSADIIGIKDMLLLQANDSAFIFGYNQGSLKGESVVAAILSSRMEQSYCTSGFFRFQARFLTSSAPMLTITHHLHTLFHPTRNLTHLPW